MCLQMSNTHNALATIYHIDNFEMSNMHNALATLLYNIKISDIMSNLIDNKLDYPNEIYNDQFISYTISQSKNNNSKDE
ncbi:36964_t:CDS:1, partial [Gigaspora margarita]